MIRAGFARPAPTTERKPMKGPRTVKCRARGCMHRIVPDPANPVVTWCSEDCSVTVALAAGAARRAKLAQADRAATKARKASLDPIKTLEDRAQVLANRYVRLRDAHLPCISCDRPASWDGQWHASHFKSRGSNSALRFNMRNIHKACSICNRHLSGNIDNYRPRLAARHGSALVEWLDNHPRSRCYDADYLRRLSIILAKKINRLKEQA